MFSHHWGPGPRGELRNLLWKHFEGKQWSALSPAAHRGTGDNIHQKWVRRVKVQDGNNRLWVPLHCRKAAQWVNLILVQCAGTVMDCCLAVQLHSVYNNILCNWTTRLTSAIEFSFSLVLNCRDWTLGAHGWLVTSAPQSFSYLSHLSSSSFHHYCACHQIEAQMALESHPSKIKSSSHPSLTKIYESKPITSHECRKCPKK